MMTKPKVELRPRQQEAYDAVFSALDRGVERQLVSLPTGVGKTVLAAHIAQQFNRVLFLVHRQELLQQAIKTFQRVTPDASVGWIWGDRTDIGARFVVGMIQTVHARLEKLPPDTFDLVIIDEAHHAAAKTWRRVADHFTPALRLGLSATPERKDGAPLSNLFDEIVYHLDIRTAIADGLLVRPKASQIITSQSLDNVRSLAGDFNEGDLQASVNTPRRNQIVLESYLGQAPGRKAVAFTAGVQHAKDLAELFCSAGVRAAWVAGDDDERDRKIHQLGTGELDVLMNAMILTEGFDEPSIGAVLMARPTKSRPLYAQMIGRGLRLHPGKDDCHILDFVDNAGRHNIVTAWDFFGRKGKPKAGEAIDPTAITPKEERIEAAIERYQEIFDIPANAQVLVREINLLMPPPEVPDLAYGIRAWHYEGATAKQLELLASCGYDVDNTDWTKGQAAATIGNLPASTKQLQLLLALGFDVLSTQWTRNQASVALDNAKASNIGPDWKRSKRLA